MTVGKEDYFDAIIDNLKSTGQKGTAEIITKQRNEIKQLTKDLSGKENLVVCLKEALKSLGFGDGKNGRN